MTSNNWNRQSLWSARIGRIVTLLCAGLLAVTGVHRADASLAAGQVVAWGDDTYGQDNVPAGLTNMTSVASAGGAYHTLALSPDGWVAAWGYNAFGQTNVPVALTNAIAIGAGWYHSLAVRNGGTVVAWGQNSYGQTNVPASATNVMAVAGGWKHSLALRADGTVVGWGNNGNGQITIPAGATGVVAIAAGRAHSMALRSGGTVVAWGDNTYGQRNVPASLSNVVAISAGANFSMAQRADGTVAVWGNNVNGQTNIPSGMTNVDASAAGGEHVLVGRASGQISGWGGNTFGQISVPPGVSNAFSFAGGKDHSVAIIQFQAPLSLVVTSRFSVATPPAGTNTILEGSVVNASVSSTNVVNGGTQAFLVGWTGSGSVPASGTSNSVGFTMTDDSSLTWDWQEYFWLDTTNTGAGTIDTPDMWVLSGSNVVLIATNIGAHSFVGWFGETNGCTTNGMEIAVPMTQARSIEARFTTGGIAPSPSPLSFTGQINTTIAGQMLTVSNTGNGPLDYTIGSDVFWLSIDNPAGMLAVGQSTTHVVNVNSLGLDPTRPYGGYLTITDVLATNSPQYVTVSLTITNPALPSKIVAWGYNWSGQTNVPVELTNAIAVAGGRHHSLALLSNGRIAAWGDNTPGQTNVPVEVTNAIAVAGGGDHSLALLSNGRVAAWGLNTEGQTNVPASVTNAIAVAGGRYHSLALLSDGRVAAWGDYTWGQTNVPVEVTNAIAVAGGEYHSLALLSDGRVAAWGDNSLGETNVPVEVTNAVAVASGDNHSLALLSDGRVAAWGNNSFGQTNVPVDVTNAVAVAGGTRYSLALLSDGRVVAWGNNVYGQTNVPVELTNAIAISAGGYHGLALVPAQSLEVASVNDSPLPPVGTNWFIRGTEQWLSVDAAVTNGGTNYVNTGWIGTGDVPASGTSNSVGITVTQNSMIDWSWATNYWLEVVVTNAIRGYTDITNGWFQYGSNVVITATTNNGYDFVGWYGETNGASYNGTMVTLPMTNARLVEARFALDVLLDVSPAPMAFTGRVNVVVADQLLVISNHSIAPVGYDLSDSAGWLTVGNPMGYLLPGESTTHVVSVSTLGLSTSLYSGTITLTDWETMSAHTNVPVGVLLEGADRLPSRVLAWGDNSSGQTNVPAGLTNAVHLGQGNGYHSVAIREDGTISAWGNNSLGQISVPSDATNALAVAVGWTHSILVRNDGTVVAWGYNGSSQTNVPPGINNAIDAAAGVYHSLLLRADGTVLGWGGNGSGQRTIPANLTNAVSIAAGVAHSAAAGLDGTAYAWGDNTYGQTNLPVEATNIATVSAGNYHTVALRQDGTVVAWGDNSFGQTTVPGGLSNVIMVAAGANHSMALQANGAVTLWGDNSYVQSVPPMTLTNVLEIAGGGYHSLALVPAQEFVVVSEHGSPVPGAGTNTVINGSVVDAMVTLTNTIGGTQYVNTGWVGAGDVPANGTSNTVSFTVTQTSSISWLWQTNYFLDLTTTSGGTVDVADAWMPAGTSVVVNTTNVDPFAAFIGWFGDTNGCTVNGMQMTIPMDQARSIEARYTAPVILVQAGLMSFTGQVHGVIQPQSLVVSNIGDATLDYTIQSEVVWLNVTNPVGMLLPGQSTTHVVRAYSRGLHARTYRGSLIVTGSAASNSPQRVAATLNLNRAAVLPTVVAAWGDNTFGQTNVPVTPQPMTNATLIAAGGIHSLAMRTNQILRGWGGDIDDQIDDIPTDMTNAIWVAGGLNHSIAIRSNGAVVAWGDDNFGQGSTPFPINGAVQVDGGTFFNYALRTNGVLIGWGFNGNGQTDTPAEATNILHVAAGSDHAVAVRGDGTVLAWGANGAGQTNVPVELTNAVMVDAGDQFSVALLANGTVVAWGDNGSGETNVPFGLTDVVSIAAGDDHVIALRANGTLVAWGDNASGQTNTPAGMTDVIGIAAGGEHSLALVLAQRIIVNSSFGNPQPSGTVWVPRGISQTLTVEAAITNGGTQFVNTGWVLGAGSIPTTGTSNTITVAINSNSTITWRWVTNYFLDVQVTGGGILSTNDAWLLAETNIVINATNLPGQTFVGWFGDTNGCSPVGQTIGVPMTQARLIEARYIGVPAFSVIPSNLSFYGQVYSPVPSQTLVFTNTGDAPLTYWFSPDVFWLSVSSPSGVVAAGQATSIVVTASSRGLDPRAYQGVLNLVTDPSVSNGLAAIAVNLVIDPGTPPSRVAAWGLNTSGQTNVPASLTNAISVSGGAVHSVALRANGRVAAWGSNANGQTNSPASLTNAIAVVAGSYHNIALRSNGTVIAWGQNGSGQTNVPAGLTNIVAVDAGWKHSMVLRSNGTVAVWGDNGSGQTNLPASATNIIALGAGRNHNVALRRNGTVLAWGDNTYGQTNVPAGLTNIVAVDGGANFSIALRADGTVIVWGLNDKGQTNVPASLTNVVAIEGGAEHAIAIQANGKVVAWGSGANGRTNVPATVTNAVDISGGKDHSLALIFAQRTLTVASPYGTPNPPVGTNAISLGGFVSASISPSTITSGGTQFVNTGWVGTGSTPASGTSNTVTFINTTNSTITWLWTTNFNLTTFSSGHGSLGTNNGFKAFGSNVVITATNLSGQAFTGWFGDTNDCTTNGLQITVPMTQARSIEARFQQFVLISSLHDTPNPPAGTNWFDRFTTQTLSVSAIHTNGGTQYVSRGWVGTGNVPLAGTNNNVAIPITMDSTITWGWSTNFYLDLVITNAGGTVNSNQGWYAPGSTVTVTATEAPGYLFTGFSGDTNQCLTNDFTITGVMTQARRWEAHFRPRGGIDPAPDSLAFTGMVNSAISSKILTVTNVGFGDLNYAVTSSVFWLTVQNPQGDLPGLATTTHVVNVSTLGRDPGTYHGVLTLTDPVSTNSPQYVTVSMTITNPALPSVVAAWGANGNEQTNVPSRLTNVIDVTAGTGFSTVLKSDGTVQVWGDGSSGQSNAPAGISNFIAIADGVIHTVGLRQNGTVVAWGDNSSGQTNVPGGLSNVTAVAAGADFSLALRSNGTVVAWGNSATNVPSTVTNAVAIAAGYSHALALSAYGTVEGWGNNGFGQTTIPGGLTNAVAVAAGGNHSMALLADGTVLAWGDDSDGQSTVPGGLTNVVAMAAFASQSAALINNGTVTVWGDNTFGQQSIPVEVTNVFAIAAGGGHMLSLSPAQELRVTSLHGGNPVPPVGTNWPIRGTSPTLMVDTNVINGGTQYVNTGWTMGTNDVPATGAFNTVGITVTADSAINWTWITNFWLDLIITNDAGTVTSNQGWHVYGSNVVVNANTNWATLWMGWLGETNGCMFSGPENTIITIPMTNARAIEAQFRHRGGIIESPVSLVYTGQVNTNIAGQLITISNSGLGMLNYTVRSDSVWLSVGNSSGDLLPGAVTTHVVSVSTVGRDPRLYQGMLTIQDMIATNNTEYIGVDMTIYPITPPNLVVGWGSNANGQTNTPPNQVDVTFVAGGGQHSVALRQNGTVFAWGLNTNGQTNVPPSVINAVGIDAGDSHNLALLSNGTVVAWGNNTSGQTNVPSTVSNALAVAAGDFHSLALRSNGTVVAWGNNGSGQANVPADITNAIDIAAGRFHSVVLRKGGTVSVWGDNTFGQTNVPAGLTNAIAVASGFNHVMALRADGTVVAWGQNVAGQTNVPATITNAISIAAGTDHSLALLRTGKVAAWGDNANGQTNVPPQLTDVVIMAGGEDHSLALVPAEPLVVTSLHDSPNPPVGTNWLIRGATVQLTVDGSVTNGGTNYVNTGWTGFGNVPALGTSNNVSIFVANVDSAITWAWGVTNYLLTLTDPVGGSITTNLAGWYLSGSNVIVDATNDTDYHFVSWTGHTNGCTLNGTQITIPMTQARTISASFSLNPNVVAWGLNDAGQTNVPAMVTNAIAVVGSGSNSVALFPDGTLVAWGGDGFGQSIPPPSATNVTAIAGGKSHVLALLSNGTVVAWGDNADGQTNVPVEVTNATAIAAGAGHSMALLSNYTIAAWGLNDFGQTNVPTTDVINPIGVAAGARHSAALLSNGTVWVWGDNTQGQTNVPLDVVNATAIASGDSHLLALLSNGTVVAWGDNAMGQTNVPPSVVNAIAIAAGVDYSMALLSDRRVVAWGNNANGQTNIPSDVTNVLSISAGGYHGLAVVFGQKVTVMSDYGTPDLPVGDNWLARTDHVNLMVASVVSNGGTQVFSTGWVGNGDVPASGTSNSVGITIANQDSVIAWQWGVTNFYLDIVTATNGTVTAAEGWYNYGTNVTLQAQAFTNLQYTFAGWTGDTNDSTISNNVITLPMTQARTVGARFLLPRNVVAWGRNLEGQTNVPLEISTATAIAAGRFHSLAMLSNGAVVAWGYDVLNQTNVPPSAINPIDIAAGGNHSMVLHSNGSVVAWGFNDYGQTNIPVEVTNAITIACGNEHSLAVLSGGAVAAWGRNQFGQTNVPVEVTTAVAVAGGFYHSMALLANGAVAAWGDNSLGQTNVPVEVTNAIAIAAGESFSMALITGGTVVAWGDNTFGQTNVPTQVTNAIAIAAGGRHAMALLAGGTAVSWGLNDYGQTNVPTSVTNVTAIAAGQDHGMAIVGPLGGMGGGMIINVDGIDGSNPVPEAWLNSHGIAGDGITLDIDGDGLTALEEYVAGSNPNDVESTFRIVALTDVAGEAVVWFTSAADRVYTLEVMTDLATANWTAVEGQINVAGNGGVLTLTDNNPPVVPHYYRIRVSLP